jgi:hypothetical protein
MFLLLTKVTLLVEGPGKLGAVIIGCPGVEAVLVLAVVGSGLVKSKMDLCFKAMVAGCLASARKLSLLALLASFSSASLFLETSALTKMSLRLGGLLKPVMTCFWWRKALLVLFPRMFQLSLMIVDREWSLGVEGTN